MERCTVCAFALASVLLSATGYAHRPTISDGTAVDAAHAIEFQDAQVSRAVYHQVTGAAPRVWITFEVDRPQELFLQIGVPVLERLRAYRPSLALLGPGLPEVSLPFATPEGLGGIVLGTGEVETPREFFEPFTRTRSWILRGDDVRLPQAGRYYLVAYEQGDVPGKLWAALGTQEVWSAADLLQMSTIVDEVRRFHECDADEALTSGDQRVVFDFDLGGSQGEWVSVNDDVMGGVSEGSCSVTPEGLLRFRGDVSLENNGGFASIRSLPQPHDLSAFRGLVLRVRGDGKRYACNLRTGFSIRAGAYRRSFETVEGQWLTISLGFRDFVPTSFGRALPDAPALDTSEIRSIGFTVSDGQEGPFELELDWIRAFKDPGGALVETEFAEAGCARCVCRMEGATDCRLAVEIYGRCYLVVGSTLEDHGDARAADGLCSTARRASVRGEISGARFLAERFALLP
jgi:NADH dehydrogenase [ubiquinone] 1 alpha subcomplex assembly factor 1